MAERGWGRVLTVGSVQQVRPSPTLAVYAALKSAQANLAINLAKQYAGRGVTVNNLAPGLIDTDRNDDIKGDAEGYAAILARIPAGQAGTPEDCAWPALLLCSDAGRYVTGADLMVDGGLHLP
jgi:NAD(P)-dependent dehydrogenase (short-subunit alcohol dehydrogenase family)